MRDATTSKAAGGPEAAPAIAGAQFRTILGHYPTGVAVVTAMSPEGEPVGMTVGSFTSVSLDPPLIGFLPTRDSRTFGRLREAGSFCVNVLAADQEQTCRLFARGPLPGVPDERWKTVRWHLSPSGAPVLDDAVAWIDCALAEVAEAGDHFFVMGQVRLLEVVRPVQPLLFFQGGYGRFVPLSVPSARDDGEVIEGTRLAERARPAIESLARATGAECSVLTAAGGDLIVVAAAAPPGLPARPVIGRRIPMLPPLGEAYMAWQSPAAIDYWLARAAVTDPESASDYRRRLCLARERGWSMSLAADVAPGADAGPAGENPHEALYDALLDYSRHSLTPARKREIEQEIARMSPYYMPTDLEPGGRYDVHSLVAPVFGTDGLVTMALRLSRLPRRAAAEEVQRWAALLVETARALSAGTPDSTVQDNTLRDNTVRHAAAGGPR